MARILLVEDETNMSNLIVDWLTADRHLIDLAATGQDAQHLLKLNQYDAIILDWQLPDMEGIDICREFRQRGGVAPVLMLTGKSLLGEKEMGFNAGADDYLTKPFHMKELSMRVNALLRRPAAAPTKPITIGSITIDSIAHKVTKKGKDIALNPKDFALLEFLASHPSQLFSAEAIITRLGTSNKDISADAIRQSIKRIRERLDEEGQPSVISSVYGMGYRFESQ